MNSRTTLPLLLFLMLAAVNLVAKGGMVEVYGIVDKVVFEPNEAHASRVKVWGAFALASPGEWRPPTANNPTGKPAVGFVYFKLPTGGPAESTKKAWGELKAYAGTSQAIAIGKWDVNYVGAPRFDHKKTGYVLLTHPQERESLRVHPASEHDAKPVTFLNDIVIAKVETDGKDATLTTMLNDAFCSSHVGAVYDRARCSIPN